jgi:pyroglutamyl-peptidase
MAGISVNAPVVLLTGFEPFEGATINASWEAARALDGETIAGHRIVAALLPVVFGDALVALREAIARTQPVMAICMGVATLRTHISIERVAINVDDARIPDNSGRQPVDQAIVAEGPAAYFSTLPIKAMRQALEAADIPVEISQTAGTYVCNHVFYGLMHEFATHPEQRAGFIHVPPILAHDYPAGMPLEQLVAGLHRSIEAALGPCGNLGLSAEAH